MKRNVSTPVAALLGAAAMLASSVAEAQWVMLARHVVGRVEQMSQQSPQASGDQIAGIKVSPLGDKLTHMMISSAHTGSQPDASALVLNAVLRVCKDMGVVCDPGPPPGRTAAPR